MGNRFLAVGLVVTGIMWTRIAWTDGLATEVAALPGAPSPFVCVGSKRTANLPQTPDAETTGCDRVGTSVAKPQSNPDHANDVKGAPSQYVLVRMKAGNQLAKPVSAGHVKQVVVSAGDVAITRGSEALSEDQLTLEIPLSDLRALDNGARATVRIDYEPQADGTRLASDTSYFTVKNSFSLYGVAGTASGFWIPIGLFATNFKATQDGIPLAAFPVGAAFGGRLFVSNGFYLGASAMINYAIYPSTQNQQTGSSSGSVNLQSAAGGALFDIDGYLYLGAAYLKDFRSSGDSPGAMFVVGAGPQFLQFLQAAHK